MEDVGGIGGVVRRRRLGFRLRLGVFGDHRLGGGEECGGFTRGERAEFHGGEGYLSYEGGDAERETGDDAAASVVAMVLQRFGHDVGGATTYDDG